MVKKLAATEEEIAGLHKLISDCHDLKLSTTLELAKEYMAQGDKLMAMEILNLKDIGITQRWVEYNGVKFIAASENGETELGRKLRLLKDSQKGKVIPFKDTGTDE